MNLYLRAEHLADKDTFSKSDPYAVLFHLARVDGQAQGQGAPIYRPTEIGRTEVVRDCLNPTFRTCFTVPFYFEQRQDFRVILYDYDGHQQDSLNDLLGSADFQLAKIVASKGHTAALPLSQGRGRVIVTAVEASRRTNDTITLGFAGRSLKKMDTFGLSDPYFKLYRQLSPDSKVQLHRSPVIKNTLNPSWPPFTLRVAELAGADPSEKSILFECYDEDLFSDDAMGSFSCSLSELSHAADGGGNAPPPPFLLSMVKKGKTKTYGEILVTRCQIHHEPTFAEYLAAGYQINLAVSVDFTGSNGDPRKPTSLHYMHPTQPNHYIRSITSVGEILMQYDTDKLVPCFGFGAVLPGTGTTSHFFHLNLQPNPYVNGVEGVLAAYRQCLPTLRFSGPTNFAPTIRTVTEGARRASNVYTILLILTDGEITDMSETVDAVVEADDAPLSIIITGVGHDCDFEMMNRLDADVEPLVSSRGRRSRRDIVQFVPFRNFESAPSSALAAEVLREVPEQFCRWARLAGLPPPPPPPPTPVPPPLVAEPATRAEDLPPPPTKPPCSAAA